MNEYRVTFTSETGEESNLYVTERTEASARKAFNSSHKGMGFTIKEMELVSTEACATKQQERDTLEAIRKMVAELGPQSYLATAFEGCFEDAEQNIENDWGCSQKQLADSAVEKVRELEKEVQRLNDQLAESKKDYEDSLAASHAVVIQKDGEIEAIKAQVLSDDDMAAIHVGLFELVRKNEEAAAQAAADIVKYADNPASDEFLEAVRVNRNATQEAVTLRELLERVRAAVTARTAGAC